MNRRLVVGLLTGTLLFGAAGTAIAASNARTTTPTTGTFSSNAAHHGSTAAPTTGSEASSSGGMMGGNGSGGMMGGSSSSGMMGGNGSGGMMGGNGSGGMMGGSSTSGMMGGSSGGMMGGNGSGGMIGGQAGTSNGKPITLTQAQQDVQQYIAKTGKPNLAIGEVMEFQNNYYAIVNDTTKNQGAFEVLVNKSTGVVFPEYGPAMMWNTDYSVMTNMMGYEQPTGAMTVTPAQAQQLAQQWLDKHQPGSITETPDQFPGYYTLHILKGGKITGMLSVNGYSGQIWNHTWHGAFEQMAGGNS
jgi:hypothetical protein